MSPRKNLKSFFDDVRIIKAAKKEQNAFIGTLLSIAGTAFLAIAITIVYKTDGISYFVLVVCTAVQLVILVVGAIAMHRANTERINATNQALNDLRRELITQYLPRS